LKSTCPTNEFAFRQSLISSPDSHNTYSHVDTGKVASVDVHIIMTNC